MTLLRAKLRGLLKASVVEGALRGLLPLRAADWLIARLELAHE